MDLDEDAAALSALYATLDPATIRKALLAAGGDVDAAALDLLSAVDPVKEELQRRQELDQRRRTEHERLLTISTLFGVFSSTHSEAEVIEALAGAEWDKTATTAALVRESEARKTAKLEALCTALDIPMAGVIDALGDAGWEEDKAWTMIQERAATGRPAVATAVATAAHAGDRGAEISALVDDQVERRLAEAVSDTMALRQRVTDMVRAESGGPGSVGGEVSGSGSGEASDSGSGSGSASPALTSQTSADAEFVLVNAHDATPPAGDETRAVSPISLDVDRGDDGGLRVGWAVGDGLATVAPSSWDWIGVFVAGTLTSDPLDWAYVASDQGSYAFARDPTDARGPGSYEVRLVTAAGAVVGVSEVFAVGSGSGFRLSHEAAPAGAMRRVRIVFEPAEALMDGLASPGACVAVCRPVRKLCPSGSDVIATQLCADADPPGVLTFDLPKVGPWEAHLKAPALHSSDVARLYLDLPGSNSLALVENRGARELSVAASIVTTEVAGGGVWVGVFRVGEVGPSRYEKYEWVTSVPQEIRFKTMSVAGCYEARAYGPDRDLLAVSNPVECQGTVGWW